jgi:hypothetical protein
MADTPPSAFTGVFHRPFDEQVAFFRHKLGRLVPTQFWDDLQKAEHDRAFMVAGAAKADLLQDLAAAVDKAITEGEGIDAFRKDFDAIVKRNGWHGWTGESTAGGRAWRTRVIFTTNTFASYSAGRLAQLREGKFKYWVYKHTDGEEFPRPLHESWDGLILPPDHPFWQTHYPPNGWGCRCYVLGLYDMELAHTVGGDPNKKLPDGWDKIDRKTGEPAGIDQGWGYAPGATVTDDIVQAVKDVAPKLGSWDAELGKAYLDGLEQDTRDALAQAYRRLPSTADDARRYVQRVRDSRLLNTLPDSRTLGTPTSAEKAAIERVLPGTDLSGFDFSLTPDGVRDVLSAGADAPDVTLVPRIIDAPDAVIDKLPDARSGAPRVRISGIVDDARIASVWRVDRSQRTLSLESVTPSQTGQSQP